MAELSKAEKKRQGLIKEVRKLVKDVHDEGLPKDKDLFDNYLHYDDDIHREDPLHALMLFIGECLNSGEMKSGVGVKYYLTDDQVLLGEDDEGSLDTDPPRVLIFGLDDLEFALRDMVQQHIDDLAVVDSEGNPNEYVGMSLRKVRFSFDPDDESAGMARLVKLKTPAIQAMRDRLLQKKENEHKEFERSTVMRVVDKALDSMGSQPVINILTALMTKPGDIIGTVTIGDPDTGTTDSNE